MSKPPALTHERLTELLHYDPETGVFTWRIDRTCGRGRVSRRAGDVAGGEHKAEGQRSYVRIRVDGRMYKAHRLAWFYMTGFWPPETIDHEDTNGLHNAWENLRSCGQTHNHGNMRKPKDNTSGFKGVSFYRRDRNWDARISCHGVQYYLGRFDRREDAAAAYATAARELFGQFARTE
jgi:hypothetical protein